MLDSKNFSFQNLLSIGPLSVRLRELSYFILAKLLYYNINFFKIGFWTPTSSGRRLLGGNGLVKKNGIDGHKYKYNQNALFL